MRRLEKAFKILSMGFIVSVAGCGGDKDRPTAPGEDLTKGPLGQKLEVWTEKWANGQIKLEYQYFREEQSNQPIQHGYYKSYYEDGTYKQRGQFREGSKEGTFVSFDAEGTIIDEDIYARGVCVASCEWTRTFGGRASDYGHSVQQTADGGFIITGGIESYGNGGADVWLIKTDNAGTEQWSTTFGGISDDLARSVQQTADGGFIITGDTWSYGNGSSDVWLIKTDPAGVELWSRTFGGSNADYGFSVKQTTDGGFIITGHTASYGNGSTDVWLIKTDNAGTEQWSRTFGGSNWDEGLFVQQTADGGFIVTGYTQSYGNGQSDVWLIKTDNAGTEQWSRTSGGSNRDGCFSVQQTADGGFIVTGYTQSYGNGPRAAWLIKTDDAGTELWSRTFGGSESDWAYSVQQTADGGFIITGGTESYGNGRNDAWLIKTDDAGNELWSRSFGGSDEDWAYSVQQTADGGFVITGGTKSFGNGDYDVWLIKTDSEGLTEVLESD